MQVSEYDGSKLRLILIGMITDPKICSRICSVMDKPGGPRFNNTYADIIARWCREHMKKYNSPPNGSIQALFNGWAETTQDSKTASQIEALLEFMSDEHSSSVASNPDFVLDLATEYFNRQTIRDALDEVQDSMSDGKVDEAYKQLISTTKVDLGYSSVIDPFEDENHDVWFDSLDEGNETERPVFEYPGDLGKLTYGSFTKGKLFAFMGIDKIGKSFFLLDAAWRALKERKRVAYFECGDLGKSATIQRLSQRILRQSLFKDVVDWPVDWNGNIPVTKEKSCEGVSAAHAIKLGQKHTRKRSMLKLSCHTNSSISVDGISTYLQEWARESCWMPDMVVIDYADILAPPPGIRETMDQVDITWKQLRKLSQVHNCLVLTATQTGAQAYKKRGQALSRTDFSGRKTKLAEADGIIGLNATAEDWRHGITRVNWIVRRKGKSYETQQVLVAGCLAAASPIILSKYPSKKRTTELPEQNGQTDNNDDDD